MSRSPSTHSAADARDWTVGQLLEWTTAHFQKLGFDPPRLEAEVLLAEVLVCSRIQLYTLWDALVDTGHRARFRELVERRAKGCPVAYLVGKREFYSLEFAVDPRVLIPRPETEFLVGAVLDFAKVDRVESFVDVGTGSGAIAISLLKHLPTATSIAVDISKDALEVARQNAAKHSLLQRVQFIESDLLNALATSGPFDAIVSNPPYVSSTEWSKLAPGVRDFEPRLALDGGPDGLDCCRRLIPQAETLLRPGGRLFLEIGHLQETAVAEIMRASASLRPLPTIRDHQRVPRIVVAQKA